MNGLTGYVEMRGMANRQGASERFCRHFFLPTSLWIYRQQSLLQALPTLADRLRLSDGWDRRNNCFSMNTSPTPRANGRPVPRKLIQDDQYCFLLAWGVRYEISVLA